MATKVTDFFAFTRVDAARTRTSTFNEICDLLSPQRNHLKFEIQLRNPIRPGLKSRFNLSLAGNQCNRVNVC